MLDVARLRELLDLALEHVLAGEPGVELAVAQPAHHAPALEAGRLLLPDLAQLHDVRAVHVRTEPVQRVALEDVHAQEAAQLQVGRLVDDLPDVFLRDLHLAMRTLHRRLLVHDHLVVHVLLRAREADVVLDAVQVQNRVLVDVLQTDLARLVDHGPKLRQLHGLELAQVPVDQLDQLERVVEVLARRFDVVCARRRIKSCKKFNLDVCGEMGESRKADSIEQQGVGDVFLRGSSRTGGGGGRVYRFAESCRSCS